MKIIQDGTLLDFDSACLSNNSPLAPLTGEAVRGRVVGHHDASNGEATHIYAQVPTNTPARYVWRRFIIKEKE